MDITLVHLSEVRQQIHDCFGRWPSDKFFRKAVVLKTNDGDGFLTLVPLKSGALLSLFGVLPQARMRGTGTALIQYAQQLVQGPLYVECESRSLPYGLLLGEGFRPLPISYKTMDFDGQYGCDKKALMCDTELRTEQHIQFIEELYQTVYGIDDGALLSMYNKQMHMVPYGDIPITAFNNLFYDCYTNVSLPSQLLADCYVLQLPGRLDGFIAYDVHMDTMAVELRMLGVSQSARHSHSAAAMLKWMQARFAGWHIYSSTRHSFLAHAGWVEDGAGLAFK